MLARQSSRSEISAISMQSSGTSGAEAPQATSPAIERLQRPRIASLPQVQTLHAPVDGATKEGQDGDSNVLDYLLEAFSGPDKPFMFAITAVMAFAIAP